MSSPGQKRGTCGHVMASFDNHKKCARCREKEVGDDPCVQKRDCQICKAFTPAQLKQLSTPTYQSRKEQDLKKMASDSPASVTPTLMDPSEVTLLGRVHKESSADSTPARQTLPLPPRVAVRRNPAANVGLMTLKTWMRSRVNVLPDWRLCWCPRRLRFL